MTLDSVQTRNSTFVKCHGFLSIAENIDQNICKNANENVNVKYSKKFFDHAK